jgi:Predicted hydrolases or acyltransferases (alpha/beta hydrolase superfamily)
MIEQSTPLVIVHGVGLTYEIGQPQLDFVKAYSSLSSDIPGHGKSSLTKQNISFDDFSDQLLELINELKIEKIHLVGFSIGSLIARNFATRCADR